MKKLVWSIIFLVVIFLAAKGYFNYLNSPLDPKGGVQAFVVNKGEALSSIADKLEQQHLIRSAWAFKLSLKFSNKGTDIIPGDFKLSPSMGTDQIVTTLSSGPTDKWVTLLEGWRIEEEADKLNQDLGIDKKAFLSLAKEGYMFPDTYLFNQDATPETVISTLRSNFDKKYSDDIQTKIKKLGLTSSQGVILASIVEREGRSDGVRQKIASILLKRLNIGMALDVDASIQYALGYSTSEQNWWRKNITADDLKVNSPYNTYTHPGLPPTPICNPSLSSLQAVANADPSTPYLYYYHDSEGNSYYDATLEGHNQNVANHP